MTQREYYSEILGKKQTKSRQPDVFFYYQYRDIIGVLTQGFTVNIHDLNMYAKPFFAIAVK